MNRNCFLGNIDLGITHSLLSNYSVSTRLSDDIKFNKIKQQNDLILIELNALLSIDECDEILMNISQKRFENMNKQYDIQKRNNSRLIVIDDQFARMLWERLKSNHQIAELISNPRPLGFNVQGTWEMNGVNSAMRLNKYHENEYFAPHKDAQYAPSGDERSLLSLIIYLNNDYEKGETKFYFPKQSSKLSVKGLTIKEEIEAYGGLDDGYECITIKPKKGHAVLFTHDLLHEAVAPEIGIPSDVHERIVLRTDVLVQRKEKPLGFAISLEEENDYHACLNFFREAQQMELKIYSGWNASVKAINAGELYERSLSIRYCYPRMLQLKSKEFITNREQQKKFIEQLPVEIWLSIFKYLDKQDIQNLIFAFPDFHLLKIVWEAEELKNFEHNLFREKFIPTVDDQYGSRTLFRFSDSEFFYRHISQCCRVAAVYAFFLLGHPKDSNTYTVHYDRNTHEVCEVQMDRLLSDIFYNRNCYGSLYRVEQKDKTKRQPMIDLGHSVDRTYMTNRHQAQFIGQDLLSLFHFETKTNFTADDDDDDESDSDMSIDDHDDEVHVLEVLARQRKHALEDREQKLVDQYLIIHSHNNDYHSRRWRTLSRDDILGYHENLLKQIDQDSGAALCRMVSVKGHFLTKPCCYEANSNSAYINVPFSTICYNHLIFDFDTHQLVVERLSDEIPHYLKRNSLLYDCVQTLRHSISRESPILFYRVNIEKLAKVTKGFNHAGGECYHPRIHLDQFSFLDYTYLSYVHLAISQSGDHVFVLTTYGGVAAL